MRERIDRKYGKCCRCQADIAGGRGDLYAGKMQINRVTDPVSDRYLRKKRPGYIMLCIAIIPLPLSIEINEFS